MPKVKVRCCWRTCNIPLKPVTNSKIWMHPLPITHSQSTSTMGLLPLDVAVLRSLHVLFLHVNFRHMYSCRSSPPPADISATCEVQLTILTPHVRDQPGDKSPGCCLAVPPIPQQQIRLSATGPERHMLKNHTNSHAHTSPGSASSEPGGGAPRGVRTRQRWQRGGWRLGAMKVSRYRSVSGAAAAGGGGAGGAGGAGEGGSQSRGAQRRRLHRAPKFKFA